MTDIRPRKIMHKGRIEAAGFLFDTNLIGVDETRRRILNLWEAGVQIFADGPNHFVRLAAAIRVDCAHSIATPLVQIESVLSALPLSTDELELLDAPTHSVVFAIGGVACVTQLGSTAVESPENWLDVSAFKVVEMTSLGAAFAEPKVVAEPQPFDARAKLDGIPAETAELRSAIAAIKSAASGARNQSSGWEIAQTLRIWAREAIGAISSGVVRLRKVSNPQVTTRHQRASDQGLLAKANEWLTHIGLRLLHTSQLARVLGRRQAEYLGKMMQMFERGDLDEALKHAIPLGDLSSLKQLPALRVPTPRNSLGIFPWRGQSTRSIGLEPDVVEYLVRLYRASFDRLVAQNRIDEAAFVLVELLRANEEAVAFLERHGKLRLAAELAEARQLSPGLVVRQWFIAGDVKRAIGIARRTQSFADAVSRMERKNKNQAEGLRLLWAESLAAGGNYTSAVDVIWPIQSQRPRLREWMDNAIEVGGPVAGRMLARKLTVVPEDFADIRRRVLTFLEDESHEQRETRLAFAEALCFGKTTAETQTLARVTARAVLRDAGQKASPLTPKRFNRLVNLSGDGPLRTDVPPFPIEHDQSVGPLLTVTCATADCGTMPVHDAALLPNDRMLVALGEIGARLLTPDGRTVTHFDYPAEKLVISDNGDRAIALARRGRVWRLSRLDLVHRRGEDWCDAHIDAFASNYDGSLWFLGAKGDFYAIDAHAKSFEALWRVPEAGDRVTGVARAEKSCCFLTMRSDWSEVEEWVYQLPLLRLWRRTSPQPRQPDNVFRINQNDALSPTGVYADQSLYGALDPADPESPEQVLVLTLRVFENEKEIFAQTIGDESCGPLEPEILGRRVVSPVLEQGGVRVRVIDFRTGEVAAELFLASANQVSTRLTENTLNLSDNLGRLLVVDLQRNCTLRNLRV